MFLVTVAMVMAIWIQSRAEFSGFHKMELLTIQIRIWFQTTLRL
jgi:hypothetical protein